MSGLRNDPQQHQQQFVMSATLVADKVAPGLHGRPGALDQKAAVSEKTTWLRAIDLPTSLLSPETAKLGRR